MNNKEIQALIDSCLGDKNYVIDAMLPALRLARKALLSDCLTSKQFSKAILKIDQAITTARFMRCSK